MFVGIEAMLVTDHCTIHPSREASYQCRSCGCWLCDRCTQTASRGIFCSSRCRQVFRFKSIAQHLKSTVTSPLEGPWVIGLVGGLIALVIAGVGLLSARLIAESTPDPIPAQIPVLRLVETENGLDIVLEGPPGRRTFVVDPSERSHTVTLSEDGTARLPQVYTPPAATIVPTPTPSPSATPSPLPSPTAIPLRPTVRAVIRPTATQAPTATVAPSPTIVVSPMVSSLPAKTPRPRPTAHPGAPPILHLVIDSGPSIAITFDGGASSNRTAELLDLLQELDISATLFLTGEFIERHPALVRRAVLAGHEVGNHTFTHPHLTSWERDRRHRTLANVNRSWFLSELERSEAAFQKATGRPMAPLWRAPYGEENATLRAWALDAGYLHVRWSSLEGRSLDAHDWVNDEHSSLYRDSLRTMNRLLSFPRLEGGIVLMHLATEREEAPWAHLPEFVATLRSRGIEPCKVTTLLNQSGIWKKWLAQAEKRHGELWK